MQVTPKEMRTRTRTSTGPVRGCWRTSLLLLTTMALIAMALGAAEPKEVSKTPKKRTQFGQKNVTKPSAGSRVSESSNDSGDLEPEETRSFYGVRASLRPQFSSIYPGFVHSNVIHRPSKVSLKPIPPFFEFAKPSLSPIFPESGFIPSLKPLKPSRRPSGPPAATMKCGKSLGRPCESSRYRSYDGSCNNQLHPTWGMANTKYTRLLPPNYADNVHEPPVSTSGSPLPLSREVSYVLFPHADIPDKRWTLAAMQYGQIITHDMAMIDGSTQSKAHATRCCTDDGQLIPEAANSPLCFPILLPAHDPVYSRVWQKCHNFVRSTTTLDRGCTTEYEPAEQLTVVSHFLDLSLVYGSTDQVARGLRAGVGGRLNVDVRSNREWLPTTANKSAACDNDHEAQVCYMAGDVRVNQNPQLTILQIILHREHNRVANELQKLNPHWSDETTFQEARRIVIAEHQHISYYEWLPIFIGMENSYKHKILYATKGYVNDYDPAVNPSVINEHSTAAFRYFHSLIAGKLHLVDEQRFAYSGYRNALRLSDHFNKPQVIELNGNFDKLTRGMATQPEENSDQFFDKEITRYLFRNNRPLGEDLRAIDIQRNRDHGLANYNNFREYCGMKRATTWADFADLISLENIEKLAQLYESVDDVDLTVGGSLEAHVEGTLAGPTFICILTEQFYRTRVGDRFWYETGKPEIAFTIEQLTEIRKASIARLFCDNGDHIQLMQMRAFELVSQSNPLVSCSDVPALDLSYWKDYASDVQTVASPFFQFKK